MHRLPHSDFDFLEQQWLQNLQLFANHVLDSCLHRRFQLTLQLLQDSLNDLFRIRRSPDWVHACRRNLHHFGQRGKKPGEIARRRWGRHFWIAARAR